MATHVTRSDERPALPDPVVIRLADAPTHEISPLLFGQFLERFGSSVKPGQERGPQAAVAPGGKFALRADVTENLQSLGANILRFPGGFALETDYDWTRLIDRSPWREGARETGREFGYEEFFALARALRAEPLIVANFRHAVWGAAPGEVPVSAETMAAGLVAYCNLPVGAKLPEGMPDWPAIRAANGHPTPHRVRYFQIGNEWVAWMKGTHKVREVLGLPPFSSEEDFCQHLKERLLAVAHAMKQVDPSIQIIIDAVLWDGEHESPLRFLLSDPEVKEAVDLAAVHLYAPWTVKEIKVDGVVRPPADVSEQEIWHAAVATPSIGADGQSRIGGASWNLARSLGWRVAITEWNWNGWGIERPGASLWARGLGAAGFLHAFLREAGEIELATQSMMVGDRWNIAGVRVGPDDSFIVPTAAMTTFYRRHAARRFLPVRLANIPMQDQPVTMGSIRGGGRLALLDVIATEDDDRIVLHIIQRDPEHPVALTLETARRDMERRADHHWLEPTRPLAALDPDGDFESTGQFTENHRTLAANTEGSFQITLPPATLHALVIKKR